MAFFEYEIPDNMKVPVTVLTGFLGAGKTTLLNHILTTEHGCKFAVIENEFGEIGIDAELVQTKEALAEEIVSMDNGCLCCTVRGDLIKGIRKILATGKKLDGILIETTGMADPAPVVKTFFEYPDLKRRCRVDGIITVVDSKHISKHLFSDKGELQQQGYISVATEGEVNISMQQVAFADRIILNKTDLVTENELIQLKHDVKSINKLADHITAVKSVVDPKMLININRFSLDRALETDPDFLAHNYHDHDHGHGHSHGDGHENCDHDAGHCEVEGHSHGHGEKKEEHVHGHGHGEKKEAGHGHGHAEKEHGHGHRESQEGGHEHGHSEKMEDGHAHGHGEKKKEGHGHGHSEKKDEHAHGHGHGEKNGEGHGHGHAEKEHGHGHGEKKDEHAHGHGQAEKEHGHGHAHKEPAFKPKNRHDIAVTSVGIKLEPGEHMALAPLQQWIAQMLAENEPNLYRYKGIISLKSFDEKFIFQGVHAVFDYDLKGEWEEPEHERVSKFVFIGKNLNRDEIIKGFRGCIVPKLRFGLGDLVYAKTRDGWLPGHVNTLWEKKGYEVQPYRIKLLKGTEVYGPQDDDRYVRDPKEFQDQVQAS